MTRSGHGHAHGAITIVNGTATGIGCSLAVEAGTSATLTWRADDAIHLAPNGVDDALVRSVVAVARQRLGQHGGADVSVTCPWPPSRGLKTSSSVATALLRAAADAAGQTLANHETESLAVQACRAAGVTITGALDDQLAVTRGGCHVADNRAGANGRVLHSLPSPRLHVAIWVPTAAIPKSEAARVDVAPAIPTAHQAARLAEAGDLAGAMTLNGAAFTAAYAGAGLPIDARPAFVALQHGAVGAGLSGTGPAVAALFRAPVELPSVPGGAWSWTKVAP